MSASCGWEGKGRYGSFRLQMNVWVCRQTVKSLENTTCRTWALLRWWLTTKRLYIKCVHLYLVFLQATVLNSSTGPKLVQQLW